MASILVGTSGWRYAGWKRHLYRGIPQRRWLAHAASSFDTLEINGSFYVQIRPATYRQWHDATPEAFRFSLKAHRYLTHYKRLAGVTDGIHRLRDQSAPLGAKLVCVLWQLPLHVEANPGRLEAFLEALAAHWPGPRHALEVRHPSWFTDEVAAILSRGKVAACWSDAPTFRLWPVVTTDLVYVRLHGHTRLYASSYGLPSLRRWAARARGWVAEGRDVLVYFDNDAEGAAVHNARALMRLVHRA